MKTKAKYYNAFTQIEDNHKTSKIIDLTPFIDYFNQHVYKKIDDQDTNYDVIETFNQYLKEGNITEKEKDL